MNNSVWWNICRKDLRDIIRSRLLMSLLAGLAFIVLASTLISSVAFHSQLVDFQKYVAALRLSHSTATPTAPELYPLQLLIGGVEYLEIIGALLAVIIGYGLIAKEKTRGTLQLLLSRPLSSRDLAFGKLAALTLLWCGFCLFTGIGILVILLVIGGTHLTGTDILRVSETLALLVIYLMFWSSLALGLASATKQLSTALIIGLTLWLVVVLILPQIGDTMDPDNQIPGGLFNSLQVTRPQQHAIMAHFMSYELGRNYVEAASVEKHFERATFGFTGIKPIYNQKTTPYVLMRLWPNITAVVLWALAGIIWAVILCSKKRLLKKEQ